MFQPLITYNQEKQKFDIHPQKGKRISNSTHVVLNSLSQNQLKQKICIDNDIYFISVIDVKPSDLVSFTNINPHSRMQFGMYISSEFNDQTKQKRVRYIYVPPLNTRLQQKFQDLLASLAIMLSNVCIFDISSKYIRQGQQFYDKETQRYNYLIMHSHGAEMFKVGIQNKGNKMEIGNKIQSKDNQSRSVKQAPGQILQNLKNTYRINEVIQIFSQVIKHSMILKNYLSFEEIKLKLSINFNLMKYIQANSKEYHSLFIRQNMLSNLQKTKLLQQIKQYAANQSLNNKHFSDILEQIKRTVEQKIEDENKKYLNNFLLEIKSSHFSSIGSRQQFQIKKHFSKKIFIQYDIPQIYESTVLSQSEIKLCETQIHQLAQIKRQQYSEIMYLKKDKQEKQTKIETMQQQIKKLKQQNHNFREINKLYQETNQLLKKQRQINKKTCCEIQSLLIEQKARKQNQKRLQQIIQRIAKQKDVLKQGLEEVNSININLNKRIQDNQNQIETLKGQIYHYQKLESKARQSIQEMELAKQKLNSYQNFSCNFVENLQIFKAAEVQKFNYILKRNLQKFQKLEKQKQALIKKYKEKNDQNNALKANIMEYKIALELSQKQLLQEVKTSQTLQKISDKSSESEIRDRFCLKWDRDCEDLQTVK